MVINSSTGSIMTSSIVQASQVTTITKTHYSESCKFTSLTDPLTAHKEVIVVNLLLSQVTTITKTHWCESYKFCNFFNVRVVIFINQAKHTWALINLHL